MINDFRLCQWQLKFCKSTFFVWCAHLFAITNEYAKHNVIQYARMRLRQMHNVMLCIFARYSVSMAKRAMMHPILGQLLVSFSTLHVFDHFRRWWIILYDIQLFVYHQSQGSIVSAARRSVWPATRKRQRKWWYCHIFCSAHHQRSEIQSHYVRRVTKYKSNIKYPSHVTQPIIERNMHK